MVAWGDSGCCDYTKCYARGTDLTGLSEQPQPAGNDCGTLPEHCARVSAIGSQAPIFAATHSGAAPTAFGAFRTGTIQALRNSCCSSSPGITHSRQSQANDRDCRCGDCRCGHLRADAFARK